MTTIPYAVEQAIRGCADEAARYQDKIEDENRRLRWAVRDLYSALETVCGNFTALVGRHITKEAAEATDADLADIRRSMLELGIDLRPKEVGP